MRINRYLFVFEKRFKNNNTITFAMNFTNWGLGLCFDISKSKIWFDLDFLCWHFNSRIIIKNYDIDNCVKGYYFTKNKCMRWIY